MSHCYAVINVRYLFPVKDLKIMGKDLKCGEVGQFFQGYTGDLWWNRNWVSWLLIPYVQVIVHRARFSKRGKLSHPAPIFWLNRHS